MLLFFFFSVLLPYRAIFLSNGISLVVLCSNLQNNFKNQDEIEFVVIVARDPALKNIVIYFSHIANS